MPAKAGGAGAKGGKKSNQKGPKGGVAKTQKKDKDDDDVLDNAMQVAEKAEKELASKKKQDDEEDDEDFPMARKHDAAPFSVGSVRVFEVVPTDEQAKQGDDVEIQGQFELEGQDDEVEHVGPDVVLKEVEQGPFYDAAIAGDESQDQSQRFTDDRTADCTDKENDDQMTDRLVSKHVAAASGVLGNFVAQHA